MKFIIKTPKQALKAVLKERPSEKERDVFSKNLITLIDQIATIEALPKDETEEHLKIDMLQFLRDTYYRGTNAINTKYKEDLAIYLDKTTSSKVGVIIEAKRPSNVAEMLTGDVPNKKALHELILYYLNERYDGNFNLTRLIATNINEWFIIDANDFDTHIYKNTEIRNLYDTKVKDKKPTPYFYTEVERLVNKITAEIPCVYFNIRGENEKLLRNEKKEDAKELVALYKILSPQYLLKIKPLNDSNKLDKGFYNELLHIIGLEETSLGTIRRKVVDINPASLIELTIDALNTEDVFSRVPNIKNYGDTKEEQAFNIALELCITWVNRVLFLKLLEGQLIGYHSDKDGFNKFLNSETVKDFDELYNLFHKVLAVETGTRIEPLKTIYKNIPYLNSSLFEISDLEHQTVRINAFDNNKALEIINTSVLKDEKKNLKSLKTLDYLLRFLDAYDFATEGEENWQKENRTLINASVLGKVFEKINGYKDGSIFTPAFITMYMCRQSIRDVVTEKFNQALSEGDKKMFDDFEAVKTYTGRIVNSSKILRANEIINSIRICDPAVGSGHFLVSALNELIVIKAELKILIDDNGSPINGYEFDIVNDELIILDREGNNAGYKLQNGKPLTKESQRLQKSLFHEKQTLIENCLFGVDINSKSVLICRLRLWIELLKNAYYKESDYTELETLPNIDINIKCGNSLINRFALLEDLTEVFRQQNFSRQNYLDAVTNYKNAKSKTEKESARNFIQAIKDNFQTIVYKRNQFVSKLSDVRGKLEALDHIDLFGKRPMSEAKIESTKKKLLEQRGVYEKQLKDYKNSTIYNDALEWRFEFPEVLNDNGDYVGFDLVIGNPPYISLSKIQKYGQYFESQFDTYTKNSDIYCLFYERGISILKGNGLLAYITSNSWMQTQYGKPLRDYFVNHTNPKYLINIEDTQVFEQATVESNILIIQKEKWNQSLYAVSLKNDFSKEKSLIEYVEQNKIVKRELSAEGWSTGNEIESKLQEKIATGSKKISGLNFKINRGITTGLNEAFFIDGQTRQKFIEANPNCDAIIKPALRGRNISKYNYKLADYWLILIENGWTNKNRADNNPEEFFKETYPAIYEYFIEVSKSGKAKGKGLFEREDQGEYWWELRPCVYYNEFEKEKIVWGELSDEQKFAFDSNGLYANNTIFFLTGKDVKYLLAILNSKLSKWAFKQIATSSGMGTNRWLKYKIELLPVKEISDQEQQLFIDLVEKIILQKQQGKDTNDNEKEIDKLVYALYGITDEKEIALIEK